MNISIMGRHRARISIRSAVNIRAFTPPLTPSDNPSGNVGCDFDQSQILNGFYDCERSPLDNSVKDVTRLT